ncbi:MAG: HEPN domain-containing protein [Candidatus Asgardarchaeia archaeon]
MVEEWIRRAKEFLDEAENTFARKRYWLTCFHAQQAAEFILKAVLLYRTGTYIFTHSLSELISAISALDEKIPDDVRVYADALEQHYTRARYPRVHVKEYCEEDAKRCLRYARRIFSFAMEIVKT